MSAITQLGHDSMATRTGAIYALERVAQDSSQEHWTMMEILTAFVRENGITPKLTNFTRLKYQARNYNVPTDIQAAVTVIGRRNTILKIPQIRRLDLRNARTSGSRLE